VEQRFQRCVKGLLSSSPALAAEGPALLIRPIYEMADGF
jgi:hypothetical protein